MSAALEIAECRMNVTAINVHPAISISLLLSGNQFNTLSSSRVLSSHRLHNLSHFSYSVIGADVINLTCT